ncbi:2-isopropylmalate synthase [Streptomyces sp. NPDC002088]|uniref:2-isopropylmalate synthase n=1 Tax=Streptomyces sp. NPDC002088 TaxID=3154665 RepID=UPI00331FB87E
MNRLADPCPEPFPAPPEHTLLHTPTGPPACGQPWWNPQAGSALPVHRYIGTTPQPPEPEHRDWPSRTVERAPLWCPVDLRDGNQSLPEPMDLHRKRTLFDLLVRMGFKEIEVGYPSASEVEFDFVRDLITHRRIPDDVTISVFTPAKPELIDRTFEAVEGAPRVMVNLCHATACQWRETVFGMSADELERLALDSAAHIARRAAELPGTRVRFEYTLETFNVTEPDFALRLALGVSRVWDARPELPVTLNLPTTVEAASPNVFADQVEWFDRQLRAADLRDGVILSVHPHNDRGTAVASAELALRAGADRVEGTLFGNGERCGNVCLVTLALNLLREGTDPQLDLSRLDEIRTTVEYCNRLPVHPRHPYAGDLVHTAFSGTHQDAIAKGFAALARRAADTGREPGSLPWDVPYLPVDPRDIGRTYESVVRINSQSGKGGVAHVLHQLYGITVPRALRPELARLVQEAADRDGTELTGDRLWEIFEAAYLRPARPQLTLHDHRLKTGPSAGRTPEVLAVVDLEQAGGDLLQLEGAGDTPAAALVDALARAGHPVRLRSLTAGAVLRDGGAKRMAFAELGLAERVVHGAGLDADPDTAALRAVLTAFNRSA